MRKLMFVALAAVGCAQEPTTTDAGNTALGIARFATTESANQTEVIGVDAFGVEIAHVTLVHGRFTLSAPFTEDYATPDVDGRKLAIDLQDRKMRYEVAGYEPVLELPAPPAQEQLIATLVADPHVSSVLGRWGLAFEGSALDGENPYVLPGLNRQGKGSDRGDSLQDCSLSSTCGTAYNGTINTCGGGAAAGKAQRVTQRSGTNCGVYTSSYNEVVLTQCCPPGSGGQTQPWFAQKACPTTTDNNTKCGARSSGACKACPTYPVAADEVCGIWNTADVGSCSGRTIAQVNYQWSNCYLQDWSCTADADCCSYYCNPYTHVCDTGQ